MTWIETVVYVNKPTWTYQHVQAVDGASCCCGLRFYGDSWPVTTSTAGPFRHKTICPFCQAAITA